jgi:hypothetical protein
MAGSETKVDVYVERGNKRVFAAALDWPGWCRSGKTEGEAVQALLEYAPRYARVLRSRKLEFTIPKDTPAFTVVQWLTGDASTDFGVPGKIPKFDEGPVKDTEMKRLQAVLKASWSAFDGAVRAAAGKTLRKGPRGGGRDLRKIAQHVLEADGGYLARIGVKHSIDERSDPKGEMARVRKEILDALTEATGTKPVRRGPRGGVRWPPRYYVRRAAWHVLDHAWEIEDRMNGS